jgi:hypothetical protein
MSYDVRDRRSYPLARVRIKGAWHPCTVLEHQGTGIGSEAFIRVIDGKFLGQEFEVMDPESDLIYE